MKIAANIGVVDEVELIDRQISHLQSLGIDHIVVTDTGSVDGTVEILHGYAKRGEIILIELDEHTEDPFNYAKHMLERTREQFAPDWVLFGDADEFLVPRFGDLHQLLAGTSVDVLSVERYNVPVGPDGPFFPRELGPDTHDELALIVEPFKNFREHLKHHPDTPWILGRVVPKVIARTSRVGTIAMGAHSAIDQGGSTHTAVTSGDMLIAHVAISSETRFLRKLENIRRVFERFDDRYTGDAAWHWRRWLELADAGLGSEEYRRQVFDAAALAMHTREGRIATASQWFSQRPRPDA